MVCTGKEIIQVAQPGGTTANTRGPGLFVQDSCCAILSGYACRRCAWCTAPTSTFPDTEQQLSSLAASHCSGTVPGLCPLAR